MAKPKKASTAAGTSASSTPGITQVPGGRSFTLTAEWALYWVPIFMALLLCLGGMIAAGIFMGREKPDPWLIGGAALVCTLSVGALIPLSLRQAPS